MQITPPPSCRIIAEPPAPWSTRMTIGPMKKAMRKQTADVLKSLQRSAISAQSAAVLAELATVPAYTSARSASVYLPMDGSSEVDTWPILAALLSRGVTVAVPRVAGPKPGDMQMLRLSSYEEAAALPRTKWGIPEPDAAQAASMEDMTGATFDLLLVPGVAFDARCNRLGHGRGYYDCFVSRQRALERRERGPSPSPQLTVIGLGLTLQLVETVPVSETDERLDLVVHPEGQLAFADAADYESRSSAEVGFGPALTSTSQGAEEGAAEGAAEGERRAKSLRSDVGTGAAAAPVSLAEQVVVQRTQPLTLATDPHPHPHPHPPCILTPTLPPPGRPARTGHAAACRPAGQGPHPVATRPRGQPSPSP